jgi:transposase
MKSKKSKQKTYTVGVGIDCHKDILVCCVRLEKSGQIEYEEITTSTSAKDVTKLAHHLKRLNCFDACMEETGPYTAPVLSILQQNGINAQATNPRYFNHPKGQKSDSHDAKRIADVFCTGNAPASFKVYGDVLEVKNLNREKKSIIDDLTRAKNRLNRLLVLLNIRTDKKGRMLRTTIDFIKELMNVQKEMAWEEIYDKIKGVRKTTATALALISQDAIYIPSIVSSILRQIELIEILQNQIDEVEEQLKPYGKKFKKEIELICSITGLTENCALNVIGEIGNDMTKFRDGKQLTSLFGFAPTITASAGKNKCSKISHAGHHLKPFLVQCCWHLVNVEVKTRLPGNEYFNKIFTRKKEKLGGRRAIIMIARKVMVAIYHMLKNRERFNPQNYDAVMKEKKDVDVNLDNMKSTFINKETDEKLTLTDAIKLLEKYGIVLDNQNCNKTLAV